MQAHKSAPGCADIVDLPALEVCILHCNRVFLAYLGLRVRVQGSGFGVHEAVVYVSFNSSLMIFLPSQCNQNVRMSEG